MDPNATYDEMCAAYDAGDWDTAVDRAHDLSRWLARGGFMPDRPEAQDAIDYILLRD